MSTMLHATAQKQLAGCWFQRRVLLLPYRQPTQLACPRSQREVCRKVLCMIAVSHSLLSSRVLCVDLHIVVAQVAAPCHA